MIRLQSDLAELCLAAIDHGLDSVSAEWDTRASLGVVLAAGGYPDSYKKGDPISGLDQPGGAHQKVFHAGTKLVDDEVVTNGGRVLCATALGNSVTEAQQQAYRWCLAAARPSVKILPTDRQRPNSKRVNADMPPP